MKRKEQVELALQSAVRCIVATCLALGDAKMANEITAMHNSEDYEGLAVTFERMSGKGTN